MAVAFDAAGPGATGSSVSSISFTHTPVGTPTAVGVWVCGYFNAADCSGVTYGGIAMVGGTTYTDTNFSDACAKSFGLANPPSGAQTVVVSGTSFFPSADSISVTGSDTTTCFSNRSGAFGVNSTGTQSTSSSVTSAAGELVVDCVSGFAGSRVPSGVGAAQTIQYTAFWNGNLDAGISSQAGAAGTVTATWSDSGTNTGAHWAAAIDSFKAAAVAVGNIVAMTAQSDVRRGPPYRIGSY